MKVQILYDFMVGPWGGGNQFLKALREYFIRSGIYTEKPFEADTLLINSHHCIPEAITLKRKFPGKRIVHRIDGPITIVRGQDNGLERVIHLFNLIAADASVFQSEWSRFENYKAGYIENHFETTIMNAPDQEYFNRKNRIPFSKNRKIRIISTSWSGNWRKGFEVYHWLDNHLDFNRYEMTFIGNSPIRFKNICHISPLGKIELSTELKKNDIYLIASKKDPCSNALIEAMHCGLPAIALADGGHPEIVGNGGVLFSTLYAAYKYIAADQVCQSSP